MPQERSVLSVRIDSNLIADLREFADRQGVPLSRLVEDALQRALRGRQRLPMMGDINRELESLRHLRNTLAHSTSAEQRRRQLLRLRQRRTAAQERLDFAEKRLDGFDEQLNMMSDSRAGMQDNISRSEKEVAALERQLQELRENYRRAEDTLAEMYAYYGALSDERASLHQFLSEIDDLADIISPELETIPREQRGDEA